MRVSLKGQTGYIAYPPYALELEGTLEAAELELTLLGHRANSFGPVHLADPTYRYLGPNCWRTQGAEWTESYRFKPLGILSSSIIQWTI